MIEKKTDLKKEMVEKKYMPIAHFSQNINHEELFIFFN